jgi:hypothetical protein
MNKKGRDKRISAVTAPLFSSKNSDRIFQPLFLGKEQT